MKKIAKVALSVSVLSLSNSIIAPLVSPTMHNVFAEDTTIEDESKYEAIYNEAEKALDGLGEKLAKEYISEVSPYMDYYERQAFNDSKYKIIASTSQEYRVRLEKKASDYTPQDPNISSEFDPKYDKWSDKLGKLTSDQYEAYRQYLHNHSSEIPEIKAKKVVDEAEYEKVYNEAISKVDSMVNEAKNFYNNLEDSYSDFGYSYKLDIINDEFKEKTRALVDNVEKTDNQEAIVKYYNKFSEYTDEQKQIVQQIKTETYEKNNKKFEEKLQLQHQEEQKKDELVASIPGLTNKVDTLTIELENMKKQLAELLNNLASKENTNAKTDKNSVTEIIYETDKTIATEQPKIEGKTSETIVPKETVIVEEHKKTENNNKKVDINISSTELTKKETTSVESTIKTEVRSNQKSTIEKVINRSATNKTATASNTIQSKPVKTENKLKKVLPKTSAVN